MTSPLTVATRAELTEETLRLKCPGCGGGLNLKRRHLGITGQCVHCQAPLTAVEENGQIRVIGGAPTVVSHAATPPPPSPAESPTPAATTTSVSGTPAWNFPAKESEAPPSPAPEFSPAIKHDFAMPLASADTGSLIIDRNEFPESMATPPAPTADSSPFDSSPSFQGAFSCLFKSEDDSASINPAWGTKLPQESHASISPFSTGSAGGGGFAETLFREKVEKDAVNAPNGMASPFAAFEVKMSTATGSEEVCGKRTILDGDGRPLKPMTKEEEANFAKHLFAIECSHKKPRWLKRLIRFFITVTVLAGVGVGAYFMTPEEKLAEWKTKAYNWLEPGLAILDYLPDGLRPDWLPRTSLGIDAGVDENGVPREKMNALEGLQKLNTDIGKMRGTAEDEMKNIGKF